MSIRWPWSGARETRDGLENPSVDLASALTAVADDIGGGVTSSGIPVTPRRSLRIIAVYACVRVLAEAVASLPFPIYSRDQRSRVTMRDDPRWRLLNEQPNPEMTAFELWETIVGHLLLWGEAFCYRELDGAGETVALWPLLPNQTRVVRAPSGARTFQTYLPGFGPAPLADEEVLYVRAFGTGETPLSPIMLAREALGVSIAAEQYGGRFFANDARPGGLIEVAGSMDDDAFREFKARWQSGHQGLKRSHLVGVLTNGATWKDVGLPPGDAQFIETRKFGVREIARLFRVPPHMIGDLEGTVTHASIEQQAIDFVVHSLRPWLVRIEQAVKRSLFSGPRDVAAHLYPEFKVDGLMRGDLLSRFQAYAIGRQNGWLSSNDILELENRPGLGADGDIYLQPLNLAPVGSDPAQVAAARELAAHLGLLEPTGLAGNGNGHKP